MCRCACAPADINRDSFVIGRSLGCDAIVAQQQISGRHCIIYRVRRVLHVTICGCEMP